MKYFTKEYHQALQDTGLAQGFEVLEEGVVDIELLYAQREGAYIDQEREVYDSPPVEEEEAFSDLGLALEDILIGDLDEEGHETQLRHPESLEEWETYRKASYERQWEEYKNRTPFDEAEAKNLFKAHFDRAVEDKWQLPAWVYDKVDPRLVALSYLPRDIYEELEAVGKKSEAFVRTMVEEAEDAVIGQDLPSHMLDLLEVHDGNLLRVEEKAGSIFLDLIYGPASSTEGPGRLEFVEGVLLENEVGQPTIDEEGLSSVYFLAQETYHIADVFEFHFLLGAYEEEPGKLLYLTIQAKDLRKTDEPFQ